MRLEYFELVDKIEGLSLESLQARTDAKLHLPGKSD